MKNLRGAAPKTENNDDCRALAPFVMTLFDGEASETEARRARAHLLICQSCANRCLDWNRSRDMLRSAPVAAPPPQLMWRVLMACRLAAAPQRALTSKLTATKSTATKSTTRTAAPANFSDQILARTTRLAPQSPQVSSHEFSSHFSFSPLKISALAVPALALWMMVLQRDVWLPTSVESKTSEISRASAAPRRARTPRSAIAASPVQTAPDTAAQLAHSVEMPVSDAAFGVSVPSAESSRVSRSSRARAVETAFLPGASVMRAIEATFGLRSNNDFERVAAPDNWQEERDALQIAEQEAADGVRREARRAPRRAARVRLAALSDLKGAPRLRATRWQSAPDAPAASASGAPQLLRVSLPNVSAPQPARLLAENFDADDESVDEIRSVVDDFRSTLGPDDAGTETLPTDGNGLG